jgi:hypothetical protein
MIQRRGRLRHPRVAHQAVPSSVSQRPGVNPFVARLHRFWVRTVFRQDDVAYQQVAIDGKTVRRSFDRKHGRSPLHLVSRANA